MEALEFKHPSQNKFGAGEDPSLFFRQIHPLQPNSPLPVA